ncbi:MAG TPA: HepT-like ribonuclease domain-containing protein [Thermomicrobiales bacterium]|nr:HepT-like ribonuclease domain-containing protein [Thermomicrobiales bacterium]
MSAAEEISALVAGESATSFGSNRVLQLAIERPLAVVGEALARAIQSDSSLKRAFPDAPLIVSTRNRIVHDYDDIRIDIIWDITQSHIPILCGQLRTVLDEAGPPLP